MSYPPANTVFRAWSSAFGDAFSAAPAVTQLQIWDQRLRLRCAGSTLHERVRRPLVHLPAVDASQTPDIGVDLVDCAAARIAMPALPWPAQHTSLDQDTREYREGPLLFTQHGEAVITACHATQQRTVGFVRDAAHWPLDHYKQALFITLYQHLRHQGFQLVHASAVGVAGYVALIAGGSGAGKTTTMLSCLRDGFDFLGDDSTLARRTADGDWQIVTLLSTAHVTDQTLAWFPELAPHVSAAASARGKRLLFVDDAYPGCVALNGAPRVILVPQVTDQGHTTVEQTAKARLLGEMLPYSLDLLDGASARHQLDSLAALMDSVPVYRLRLGADREHLPNLLRTLLA